MKLTRLLMAAGFAFAAASVVGLAQSEPQTPGCQHACFVEYQQRVKGCGTDEAGGRCVQQAELAYQTCLAVCPGH